VEAGSFLTDALPLGADCITLNRILHDHDDGPAMTLLRATRAALAEDGALIIAEPLADTPGARPMGHGYFGLYLLAMGSGRPRTRAELTAMLRDAGYGRIREIPSAQPGLVRILEAKA
jgi:demethylspheroidene O-methyltransferase